MPRPTQYIHADRSASMLAIDTSSVAGLMVQHLQLVASFRQLARRGTPVTPAEITAALTAATTRPEASHA
ncbi:MAG: hypothetical protein R3D85_16495 [Paracoccaceae bacterium]|nr:hypothetical protein [Paracoccaceae bacterium]MCB2132376.1 hypothetical protein [Paracoccaceae bacterium]MCB2138071.1 hypothetical protein [Paracoccaceae bacterium]MCB2159963.1 hypothetical protein [Paracoccaceae bacterium]